LVSVASTDYIVFCVSVSFTLSSVYDILRIIHSCNLRKVCIRSIDVANVTECFSHILLGPYHFVFWISHELPRITKDGGRAADGRTTFRLDSYQIVEIVTTYELSEKQMK
jgi:hypothetical protein